MSSQRRLGVTRDRFAVDGTFAIARGSRTEARVLTVTVDHLQHDLRGQGECLPYAHYGETLDSVQHQIEQTKDAIEDGANQQHLLELLPAGAARNAIDAALWDLDFKVARALGTEAPITGQLDLVRTARTLSLASPEQMAKEATKVAPHFATLKLKLGGEVGTQDLERVAAVRGAAPQHRLVVDANESWPAAEAEQRIQQLLPYRLALIEQPVAAEADQVLSSFAHATPLCADESFHTAADLEKAAERYDVVNLKLDKTGGLTHALAAKAAAQKKGLGIMVGCMLGSSLAMAPALVLAQGVDLVDLDGPYLLAEDRQATLSLAKNGWIGPNPACWG